MRMGMPKQLLPFPDRPMLRVVAENAARVPLDEIVVVLGCEAQLAAKALEGLSVKLVLNSRYREGQSLSVKMGLSSIDQRAAGVMFLLGDQPLVRVETLRLLVKCFVKNKGIIAPFYNGERGNPVLLERYLLNGCIAGDEGARGIIGNHPELLKRVDVEDEGVRFDVDTWEDYQKALTRLEGRAGV